MCHTIAQAGAVDNALALSLYDVIFPHMRMEEVFIRMPKPLKVAITKRAKKAKMSIAALIRSVLEQSEKAS